MNESQSSTSIRRHWPLLTLAVISALALTLLLTMVGYAGLTSHDLGTGVQLQNLDAEPANYTVYFKYYSGTVAYSRSGIIPPSCNYYFEPDLPDDFTQGAMHVETNQAIAAVNLHSAKDARPGFNGSDVFETVPDETNAMTYLAPRVERRPTYDDGVSSRIMVGSLGTDDVTANVEIFAPDGSWVTSHAFPPIPVSGTVSLNLQDLDELGDFFIGSAIVSADQPVWVDVVQANATQMAIYPAPSVGAFTLFAPYVTEYQPGAVTPTVSLQNTGTDNTTVTITPPGNTYDLLPEGSQHVLITHGAGPYVITSDQQPIAAVVSTEGTEGAFAYTALRPEQVSANQYAPMLFSGHDDWATKLRVHNTHPSKPASVRVTYTEFAPRARVTSSFDQIGPGETVSFTPPSTMTQSAAHVNATEGILVLVEGTRAMGEDRLFAYRATPSTLQVQVPPFGQLACEAGVGGMMEVFVDSADDSGPSLLLYAALAGIVALSAVAIVIGSRHARRRLLS